MKKGLLIALLCLETLKGMSPSVNYLKVPASQLPFNPFIPRVAWAMKERAVSAYTALKLAVIPASARLMSRLRHTSVTKTPLMTKKSFLTKKRLLIACGVLGLVATAACVLRAERLHGFLRPHIPIIEEIELKEVPSRDEEPQTAEVQTEVIQASIGVQTAQPADNVSRGVQTEPFYVPVVSKAAEVQTEVIQASVGMQAGQQVKYVSTGIQPESFGIPEHIQELLHRVNALGQREAEQKRALMNNVVHWNNLSEEERDLLGDTHVVPESFVTNPVCWNSLAADQQDLLLETGALSERVLFHS